MKLRMLLVFLFTILPFTGHAGAPPKGIPKYEMHSLWEFIRTEISANGRIIAPKPIEPFHFLEGDQLPTKARLALDRLKPGLTRAAIERRWSETGGLLPCQFLLLEKDGGPKFVAVRIEWRPAAMPERTFTDRKLREEWIRRHTPLPRSDDVAMRISRPYLAEYVID